MSEEFKKIKNFLSTNIKDDLKALGHTAKKVEKAVGSFFGSIFGGN